MQKIKGFTLLEVLISLFLLSLTLLTINAAQFSAVHQSRNAYLSQQALMFARNMAAYLRVHDGEVGDYYDKWRAEVRAVLPQGLASIGGIYPDHQIKVQWGEGSTYACHQHHSGTSGCIVLDLSLE